MPAPELTQQPQQIPFKIAGGNKFGRYNKISIEQTWNMLVSDGWLVPTAGYKDVLTQSPLQKGRAIFTSTRGDFLIAVWGNQVYKITTLIISGVQTFASTFIGNLATSTGDVFIAENNNFQIAITDLTNMYVYWYMGATPGFYTSSTTVTTSGFIFGPVAFTNPGYISFQNTHLIVADVETNFWYLSAPNDALSWPATSVSNPAQTGSLQSKPDHVQACVPMPGAGNVLMVFGQTVVEQWQDIGAAIFPYQRASTFNIDYGCLNASSIAALDNHIVWLAANEQSGATLVRYSGGAPEFISTDGMDFKFAELSNPTNCTGFLYRQDGHLLYQFTFPDDNLSYLYDFETKMFFTVTDENLDYHIARNVVFFANDYYFVSLNAGNLYQFGTQFTNYDYGAGVIEQIPRIRIPPPIRLPTQHTFIVRDVSFTIENGQPNIYTTLDVNGTGSDTALDTENLLDLLTEAGDAIDIESSSVITNVLTYSASAVDLSVSRNGNESFGSHDRYNMNTTGQYKSRLIWYRKGRANDVSFKIQFIGFGRFVATDGLVTIYE